MPRWEIPSGGSSRRGRRRKRTGLWTWALPRAWRSMCGKWPPGGTLWSFLCRGYELSVRKADAGISRLDYAETAFSDGAFWLVCSNKKKGRLTTTSKIALAGNELRQNHPVQCPDRLQSVRGQLAWRHRGKEGRPPEREQGRGHPGPAGIYSLSLYTLEEVVARSYLVGRKPDAILNIVDGTNIKRNLYLTTS